MITYSEQASQLVKSISLAIYSHLPYSSEVNYQPCEVKILKDDYSTIWVKWGDKYDCKIEDLPILAMCTIADNIIR